MNEYEDVVQYDIYGAIKIKGELKQDFSTFEEIFQARRNEPTKIPNNPLLTDYNWVYEHAEELFCRNIFDYQQNQGVEEYFTLFKALINKYPLEEDYIKYINGNFSGIELKWGLFAVKLIEFISYSFDDRLLQLLNKEEVKNYFLKYSGLYTADKIMSFDHIGIEYFLQNNYYSSYYTKDYKNLIRLIHKHPKITVPDKLMLDKKVIEVMCRTHHIEDFYFELNFIREQVSDLSYLEEHRKYCDEQVENIESGILPCYKEKYKKSKERITLDDLDSFNSMEKQVVERIFKISGVDFLPKKNVYEELSKYMIVGMYMSRNFQTDPYNLLIDIETLYEFAVKNDIELQGQYIYEFLTHFESKQTKEIIDIYNYSKTLPLMEILYDDWNNVKIKFVNELNLKMFNPSNVKTKYTIGGIKCFDILEIEEPILVHNTAISIDNSEKIKEMIDRITTGSKYRLCLSVQDKNHYDFYEEELTKNKKTIKLAYGPMVPDRVGTICHEDAYSIGAEDVEVDNYEYTRKLYTLKSLMESTKNYNEIVYIIDHKPFLPIGVICEDDITTEELQVAQALNIPVLYRKKKQVLDKTINQENSGKQYSYVAEKNLFKKR